jgi:hypothetical protein
MKLSQRALDIMGSKDKQPSRLKLALALGCSERWIEKLLDSNKSNGPLTTVAAVQVIREETDLNDSDIVESSELSKIA